MNKDIKKINIEQNKHTFINLLKSVDRPGADINALVYKLECSDFFTAPCSTKFHLSVRGGLCEHSLNVYNQVVKLNSELNAGLSEETMIIISLLHDLDKMGKYEMYSKNVQHYHEFGKKSDEHGKFDWVKEWSYKVKDDNNRFVYGHHGQNSEYIANTYIPLTIEESSAIVNHMANTLDEYKPFDMTAILNRYTSASILHVADFIATFLIENRYEYVNE